MMMKPTEKLAVLLNAADEPIMMKGLPVWMYFNPKKSLDNAQIIFVFHGNARKPDEYLNFWKEFSDASSRNAVIVVPEFSKEDFPGSLMYMQGNVFDSDGNALDESDWTFGLIDPIFEQVKQLTGCTAKTYSAFGHSAGAQFLHRFAMLVPTAKVDKVVVANAGWWTQPFLRNGMKGTNADSVLVYPYGLCLDAGDGSDPLSTFNNIDFSLKTFASLNVTVLVGQNDVGVEGPNNGSPQPPANTASDDKFATWWSDTKLWQANGVLTAADAKKVDMSPYAINQIARRDRGHFYFKSWTLLAKARGWKLNWQTKDVVNVGHDGKNMGRAAYKYFDPSVNIVPSATTAADSDL